MLILHGRRHSSVTRSAKDRLDFVYHFAFPPNHAELLSVRESKKERAAYDAQLKEEFIPEHRTGTSVDVWANSAIVGLRRGSLQKQPARHKRQREHTSMRPR